MFKYAPYWEDDQTMNPVLVRYVSQKGDFFTVLLPNSKKPKQVHLHTLGKFRTA